MRGVTNPDVIVKIKALLTFSFKTF